MTFVFCPVSTVAMRYGKSKTLRVVDGIWLNVCGQMVVSVWSLVHGQRAVSPVGSVTRPADVFCVLLLTADLVINCR